jgi:hypothetical protein
MKIGNYTVDFGLSMVYIGEGREGYDTKNPRGVPELWRATGNWRGALHGL